jgi:hypothetical protein
LCASQAIHRYMRVELQKTLSQTIDPFLQQFDEKTDEFADRAVDSVKRSVSSFWNLASGYATQMFTEEDLESEAILVGGDDKSPVVLDRGAIHQLLNIILKLRILVMLLVSTLHYAVKVKNYSLISE